jgi:hypothetical protein
MSNQTSPVITSAAFDGSVQEANAQSYIQLIQDIDALLRRSVTSLIDLADAYQTVDDTHRKICGPEALYFPPWVGGDSAPCGPSKFLLTRAVCCAALQRFAASKRRFAWTKDLKGLEGIEAHLADTFIPSGPQSSLKEYAECLSSLTLGGINPLTASQVFRVLVYGGENKAHRGIGFLAFFVMVWSLRRRFPEGNVRGASLEPWQPTSYLTAKCLFPIRTLVEICERRAYLYAETRRLIGELDRTLGKSVSERWRFASTLSDLSIKLSDMAKIAIAQAAFRESSEAIEKLADSLDSSTDSNEVWSKVKVELTSALKAVSSESGKIWGEAADTVRLIDSQIIGNLRQRSKAVRELKNYGINIDITREDDDLYWSDQINAAEQALAVCKAAEEYLGKASEFQFLGNDTSTLTKYLDEIAAANRDLSDRIYKVGVESARWCHSVVEREIAHASAGNATDFDAAELVSAIGAAVRWRQMTSPLEIADAIQKAVEWGARIDGSWAPGQPIYTHGRLLAVYPITSDIVWSLANAVRQYPEITAADDTLKKYVSWLNRTASESTVSKGGRHFRITGWASDRSRERNRIDLLATAVSVNALLETRDLIEERIWQICRQRFNIVSPTKGLANVDPVDLGARHAFRLHGRLAKMARQAQAGERDAEYAFILHGPPGSSKTAMAQAVAKEMWRTPNPSFQSQRLIRITPADFTRFGEDRLDSEARFIFTLLAHVRGAVVLFDEVDDLLRKRDPAVRPVFMELIIPAMLNRLADLRESCPRQEVCYIFATNFVQNIEAALMRRGRLDAAIPVVYPDTESRRLLVERRIQKLEKLEKNRATELETLKEKIVDATTFWPWMTIQDFLDELCKDVNPVDRFGILVSQYQSELSDRPYDVKFIAKPPTPRQLLIEFIHYSFSGWSTLHRYKEGFSQKLKDWGLQQSEADTLIQQGAQIWQDEGRPSDLPSPFTTERESISQSKAA